MERLVKYKDTVFSKEKPLICAPVVSSDKNQILSDIEILNSKKIDIIEWRIDYAKFDVIEFLPEILSFSQKPIIVTFRSKEEGGVGDRKIYTELIEKLVLIKEIPVLDIELSLGKEKVKDLIKKAKENGIITIVSAHFFEYTPSEEKLVNLFADMKEVAADVPKIATMPQKLEDVLRVMKITEEASRSNSPVIGISMSKLGLATRLCPAQMGSCLSFASGVGISAPGQVSSDIIFDLIR